MTTETNEIVWRPTAEVAERSRIARFMRAQRIGSLAELHARSVADPEWYWDAVVRDLGVRWAVPTTACSTARAAWRGRCGSPAAPELRGQLCRSPHRRRAGDKPAIVGKATTAQSRTLTYSELAREVEPARQRARRRSASARATASASSCRCRRRRRSPRSRSARSARSTRRASRATARRRWPRACRTARRRSLDHRRRLLPPRAARADEGDRRRGGGRVPRRSQHVLVVPAPRPRDPLDGGARRLVARGWSAPSDACEAAARRGRSPVPASSTRRARRAGPKGAVLTHGGFLIKAAHDLAYCFDVGRRATGCSGSRTSAG